MSTLSSRHHTWSYLGPFCQTFGPFYQICVCFSLMFWMWQTQITQFHPHFGSQHHLTVNVFFLSQRAVLSSKLWDTLLKTHLLYNLNSQTTKVHKKSAFNLLIQQFDGRVTADKMLDFFLLIFWICLWTVWWTRRSKFWTRVSAKENGGHLSLRRALSDIWASSPIWHPTNWLP